jgi:hypothetical protein
MAQSGMLIALDPFVDRWVNGAPSNSYLSGLNVVKIGITTPDPEKIENISHELATIGQALDFYNLPKPDEVEIEFNRFDPDILSMVLMGTPAPYAQAGGTDQAGTVTAVHDRWVAIGKNSLTAFAVTGKVEGTDYLIHLQGGMFMALSTGSIADGASVSYTASWAARAGQTIVARTVQTLQLSLRGVGVNLFNEQEGELEIYKAVVAPTAALNWGDAKTPMSVTLKGTLVTPAGKAGPYAWTVHSAAT